MKQSETLIKTCLKIIHINKFDRTKRWIVALFLIVIITLIVGLIFGIPITQLVTSILISSILVISALFFQKLGMRQHDKKDETWKI